MDYNINDIKMHIEWSASKYLLSAYYKCQALCLVAGYRVMSDFGTLDLFPHETCSLKEWLSNSYN